METNDMHYIHYDPDELWNLIRCAYIAEGGDILYPGSEKEMLLRSVQYAVMLGLSIADNRLLMDSLRFAVGEYLDIYCEKRNCYRIEAEAAEAEVEITFLETGIQKTIPQGTALTADGQKTYLTMADVVQTGENETINVRIVASETGAQGNGLVAGTEMQFVTPNSAVETVIVTQAASGGLDEEKDEHYRERAREYGLTSITTGPKQQYEQAARSVSADILDAMAVKTAPCAVCVYIIVKTGADAEKLKTAVTNALTEDSARPLTDQVTVTEAQALAYTLNVEATLESGTSEDDLRAAIAEYQAWQDDKMQRPFNPDRLMAMLYTAGASRVTWGEDSNFNGGSVEYTAIGEGERCLGSIQLTITA